MEKTYLILHGWESREQNKTRTQVQNADRKHYGLGIKYGLMYKTRTEHCGLGIKHGERYKILISYQVITVHQKNGI